MNCTCMSQRLHNSSLSALGHKLSSLRKHSTVTECKVCNEITKNDENINDCKGGYI